LLVMEKMSLIFVFIRYAHKFCFQNKYVLAQILFYDIIYINFVICYWVEVIFFFEDSSQSLISNSKFHFGPPYDLEILVIV
jgi:hypothetical protein